jgi:hypothetical protein
MRDETRNKLKIAMVGFGDLAFDIIVPTLIYLGLRPLGVPLVLAMATGGMVIAAKAGLGKVGDHVDLGGPGWTRPQRRDLLLAANTSVAIALMFGLHAVGFALVGCVVAGALVQGVGVTISVLTRGKADGLALLVLVELAMSVVLAFVSSNDPRYFAVRPVFYLAIVAVVLAASCFRAHPGMFVLSRPMAVAGDPKRAVAYDAAWRNSAGFRALMRGATVVLTLVIAIGSAAWVYVAFQFPANRVLAANTYSELPLIILFVLFMIGFRALAVPRATRFVEAELVDVD